jgi:Glycosyl transferase family 2
VVIPTYNRAQLIGRALDSALEQTREGDEVIVVDDGSTDGTMDVLATYGDSIRVVRGEQGGAGAARNRGIAIAKCDLIAFLDSDDEWFPGKMYRQRALFQALPDLMYSFGDMACTMPDGSIKRRHLWTWHRDPRPWDEILPREDFSSIVPLAEGVGDCPVHLGDLFGDLAHRLYVLTSSYMVRRVETGSALRFEEGVPVYEDWACFARVAEVGTGAFLDTELAWQHCHAPDRLSSANALERSTVHLALLESIWSNAEEYQATCSAEFEALRESVKRDHTKNLILAGDLKAADRVLDSMLQPPRTLKVLSALPGPLVSGLLTARRRLWPLRG